MSDTAINQENALEQTPSSILMTWKDIDLLNNEAYVSENLDGFLAVLTHYEPELLHTLEGEIWEIARKSEDIPDMAEITHQLVMKKLANAIADKAVEENGATFWSAALDEDQSVGEFVNDHIEWYVDGRYVDLYIKHERVFNLKDIETQVAAVISDMKEDR